MPQLHARKFDTILNNNVKIVLKTYDNSIPSINHKTEKITNKPPVSYNSYGVHISQRVAAVNITS